jgi:cytidylate kinase
MAVTAITISRQVGSLGTEVATVAGQRLGYRVVWRDVINQAALQAGMPEVALAMIDELGLLGLRPPANQTRAYHEAVRRVIEGLAQAGNVIIIGRASQVILRDWPDVLHVRIVAPAIVRAVRVAQEQSISLEAAHAQIEASDRSRRSYLQRYYHVHWHDPDLYDLTINSARLSPTAAADLICQAVQHLPQTTMPQNPQQKESS